MEAATQKLQILDSQSVEFKVLNAMLHGTERFPNTQQIVLSKINTMGTQKELKDLAYLYEQKFLKPLLSKDRLFVKKGVKAQVRERDGNKCVLTGQSDFAPGTKKRQGFKVTYVVPYSIYNSEELQSFIRSLVPWFPEEFFSKMDSCENAILLNQSAHRCLGKFMWFIEMEENEDPNLNVYRASQIEENGLLKIQSFGRIAYLSPDEFRIDSSYNQPLYIGVGSIPRPNKEFVRLHELLARIIHMRGGAESLMEDSDDDNSELQSGSICSEEKWYHSDKEKVLWLWSLSDQVFNYAKCSLNNLICGKPNQEIKYSPEKLQEITPLKQIAKVAIYSMAS